MSERPLFSLATKRILTLAIAAHRKGDFAGLEVAERELRERDSPGGRKALAKLEELLTNQPETVPNNASVIDARAPCLYAISLRENSWNLAFYVGKSDAHSALCKASIHIRGACICGLTATPNQKQRSRKAREHGIRLEHAKAMPDGISKNDLTVAEEKWAQQLATEQNVTTWCNGKAYRPRR